MRRRTAFAIRVVTVLAACGLVTSGVMDEYKKNQAFLEAAAKQEGAVKTSSGLIFKVLTPGTGEVSPKLTDTVKVNYRGTFPDGRVFDSSYKRGEPTEFPVNKVIKCWSEGLQRMKAGESAQLVCPPGIAYGDKGMGSVVPPGAVLVFQIELLEIVK